MSIIEKVTPVFITVGQVVHVTVDGTTRYPIEFSIVGDTKEECLSKLEEAIEKCIHEKLKNQQQKAYDRIFVTHRRGDSLSNSTQQYGNGKFYGIYSIEYIPRAIELV